MKSVQTCNKWRHSMVHIAECTHFLCRVNQRLTLLFVVQSFLFDVNERRKERGGRKEGKEKKERKKEKKERKREKEKFVSPCFQSYLVLLLIVATLNLFTPVFLHLVITLQVSLQSRWLPETSLLKPNIFTVFVSATTRSDTRPPGCS